MLRDDVEDPTESKFSPAHFWENGNFNGLADELAKQKINHFDNNEVIGKNEDSSEFEVVLTNSVEGPEGSKFSPTHFCEKAISNGLAG
ncbi:hypothetical protein JTB14_014122 [Gonioctena quinquepunctata]|nr:hypothetical protein JTB14_014122 [Gonioctena quinquepunctata]